MASNSSTGRLALSAVPNLFILAKMKSRATMIPMRDPMGLKDCAKFKRCVAVDSAPIERMYGLALVSKKLSPQVMMKKAAQNGQKMPTKLAGINNIPPKAYSTKPRRIPDL